MVSTFSVQEALLPGGDLALYTCRAGTSDGAYAQCDGGFCFTSTQASPSFPGFDEPLGENQIICSCPITIADPDQATVGYEITGPCPCEDSYFENYRSVTTNNRTGTHIPVGAPTGTPQSYGFCSMALHRRNSTCAGLRAMGITPIDTTRPNGQPPFHWSVDQVR
jgi:hypothetical protein